MSETYWNKRPGAETTQVFSASASGQSRLLAVNKDIAIPILHNIQAQTTHFKQQISNIQKQLTQLQNVTNYLVQQNKNLRMHYYKRNEDLKNMLQTIKINLNFEINDINHQIHLLKEGNCLIFKNIQVQNKNVDQLQERIDQLNQKYLSIKNNNIKLQQQVLNPLKIRIKDKLNSNYIANLSKQQQNLTKNEQKLNKQIINLVYQSAQVKKQNLSKTNGIQWKNNQNYQNKQNLKNNIIFTLKNLTQLRNDIRMEQDIAKIQKQRSQRLKQRLQQVQKQKFDKHAKKQQKVQELAKIAAQRQAIIRLINQTEKNIQDITTQTKQKTRQKQTLTNNLKNIKKQNQNFRADYQNKKQTIKNQAENKLKLLKNKILEDNKKQYEQQIALQKQEKQVKKLIQQLQKELSQLQNDYQEYLAINQKLANPVSQIQRAQFQLRRIQQNKAIKIL